MDVHKNARLTPHCRELVVDRVMKGQPIAQAAMLLGSVRGRCVSGLRASGPRDLMAFVIDPPGRRPRATARELALAVIALRRQRLTLVAIARDLGLSRSTVARICAQAGLNRLTKLEPAAEVRRYERAPAW